MLDVVCYQEDLWTVEPVKQRGVSLQLTSAVLTPMRRAHDLPILIGEPFIVTAQRNQETGPTWDRNIRCQLGNNRPGAVQADPCFERKLPIEKLGGGNSKICYFYPDP